MEGSGESNKQAAAVDSVTDAKAVTDPDTVTETATQIATTPDAGTGLAEPNQGDNLCQMLFDVIDTEGTGLIPVEKLFEMMIRLNGQVLTDEEKEAFIKCNTEGRKAELNFAEFSDLVKEMATSDIVDKAAELVLPMIDKNGDGFIDEADLVEVYKALGLPEVDMVPLIEFFDEDRDGKLNAKEFGSFLKDSFKILFGSINESITVTNTSATTATTGPTSSDSTETHDGSS